MSSKDNDSEGKTFQVVDKRRFDTSGQERGGPSEPSTPHPSSSSSTEFTLRDSTSETHDEPVAFTSFIMSLATQTLVQIGDMKPPAGMEIPIDMEAARQTIDILSMLQHRTRGNLSQEEARFFEDILHSLRISYVNKKKGGS